MASLLAHAVFAATVDTEPEGKDILPLLYVCQCTLSATFHNTIIILSQSNSLKAPMTFSTLPCLSKLKML